MVNAYTLRHIFRTVVEQKFGSTAVQIYVLVF